MRVSFQARTSRGKTIGSDNILAKYDEEFDDSGNSLSGGVGKAMKNTFKRVTGGAKAEDMAPPTDSELRTKLLDSAVQQIVVQLVNTRETIEVLLAKGKGMEPGVKDAEAGLWSRALEAWETLPPLPRPVDDAYRLYDVGVADEALAYAAEDIPAAMKFLDEAAINYGKAIDSNPGEKYFLQPQKRIETALAHYEKLQQQNKGATAVRP
jgi:tetratricopeptide (TPR) repeat protein